MPAGARSRPPSGNPGDQLLLLSRKLEALQTRVVPLAIAASQHLRKQLQLAEVLPRPLIRPIIRYPLPSTLYPESLNPQPSTLDPKSSTLNTQPSTLNPKP